MKAVFSVKLPFAKYYVREIFTDEHYILGDEKYSFDFTYQGQETEAVCIDCGEFENRLKRGTDQGTETRRRTMNLLKTQCSDFLNPTVQSLQRKTH